MLSRTVQTCIIYDIQRDHLKQATIVLLTRQLSIYIKVKMGDLTLFLRKFENIKSEFNKSTAISQYGGQHKNLLRIFLYDIFAIYDFT